MKLSSGKNIIQLALVLAVGTGCTNQFSFSKFPYKDKPKNESVAGPGVHSSPRAAEEPNQNPVDENKVTEAPKEDNHLGSESPNTNANSNSENNEPKMERVQIENVNPRPVQIIDTIQNSPKELALGPQFTFHNETFSAYELENAKVKEATQVDLLWVIDNSQSMVDNQKKLAEAFKAFSDKYLKADRDIRIARITTDAYKAGSTILPGCVGQTKKTYCNEKNALLVTGWADGSNPPLIGKHRSGKPILSNIPEAGFLGTHENWIEQLNKDFSTNVRVNLVNKAGELLNVGSSDERGMQSLWNFIERNEQGENPFFRKNSIRGIIFITDEVDSSTFPGVPHGDVDSDKVISYNTKYMKVYLDYFFSRLDKSSTNPGNYFITAITAQKPPKGIDCAHKEQLIAKERSFCNANKAYLKLVDRMKSDDTNPYGKESSVEDIDLANYDGILAKVGDSIEKSVIVKRQVQKIKLKNIPIDTNSISIQVYTDEDIKRIPNEKIKIIGNEISISSDAYENLGNVEKVTITYKSNKK